MAFEETGPTVEWNQRFIECPNCQFYVHIQENQMWGGKLLFKQYPRESWDWSLHRLWKEVDTGRLGLVHGDDPDGWYGEGGGRRVQDGRILTTEPPGKSQEKETFKKNWRGFSGSSVVKNLPANAGDLSSIPGLGRSHTPQSNYWACALEPGNLNYWDHVLQLWKLIHIEPVLCSERSHCSESPMHHT